MNLTAALIAFGLIFVSELPDKSMFASMVMSTRGRPAAVWLGAALAFAIHVTLAVTVGVVVFHALPDRAVKLVAAGLFLLGAVLTLRTLDERADDVEVPSGRRTTVTSFSVIMVVEWGDLTQLFTANLAARYGSPFAVAVGALAALWSVSALAVFAGRGLLRVIPARALKIVTSLVLLTLAIVTLIQAL